MLKVIQFALLIIFFSCKNNSDPVSYYFNSENGSDLNHGTKIEKPFKTLNKIKEINLKEHYNINSTIIIIIIIEIPQIQ